SSAALEHGRTTPGRGNRASVAPPRRSRSLSNRVERWPSIRPLWRPRGPRPPARPRAVYRAHVRGVDPMTNAAPELPVAQPASWREAGALVVALVAFVCISDVQGVLWHRSEYRSAAHWVLPGVSYAFAAGLALWRWDWVVRVALSGRF